MKTRARRWLLFFCGMMLSALSAPAQRGVETTDKKEARRAVELVGKSQFQEAKELLKTLTDGDFQFPPRPEIMGFTKDGRGMAEIVQDPPIGNRRLLLARCLSELGEHKEAQELIWALVREDCTEQEFFVLFAQEFRAADFAATTEKLQGILRTDKKGQNYASEFSEKYLTVFRALPDGDLRGAVQFIRSGAALLEQRPRYPADQFQQWTCEQFAKYPKQTVPVLIAALETNDQPTWIVRSLGLSGSPEALEPLQKAREKLKNSYVRQEIDTAIALIKKANAAGGGEAGAK